jgi:hypothetical protein
VTPGFELFAGAPNLLFRGCRWRGSGTAPGYLNTDASWAGELALHYCEAGGLGPADAQYNEVPWSVHGDFARFYRCTATYTTTGFQNNAVRPEIVECLARQITFYYGEDGPPAESGPKHLNGITFNGGQTCALVVGNAVLLASPDEAGHTVAQTDAISFFQDFGVFHGTGTNSDGSVGYWVRSNLVAGGGYCIYAGKNPGSPSDSVQNMHQIDNQVSTAYWPDGGANGPITAEPAWGTLGNELTGFTWYDGPNAGQLIGG